MACVVPRFHIIGPDSAASETLEVSSLVKKGARYGDGGGNALTGDVEASKAPPRACNGRRCEDPPIGFRIGCRLEGRTVAKSFKRCSSPAADADGNNFCQGWEEPIDAAENEPFDEAAVAFVEA